MQNLSWWQNLPSKMDPVIFKVGNFPIQWYGMMYIVASFLFYFFFLQRRKKTPFLGASEEFYKNIMTPIFLGVLIGGRLGYVLFYNFSYYLRNPLEIFLPFNFTTGQFTGFSGMSFHGGCVGIMIALVFYARRHKVSVFDIYDYAVPAVPIGYFFGRIGNFTNGELYGRITTSPIGMLFSKTDSSGMLRHPSQLYEAFSEGILCFLFLWWYKNKAKTKGLMIGLYLMSYGFVRFIIEFFRQPDNQFKNSGDALGVVLGPFSMGQVLCFMMMLSGFVIAYYFRKESSIIYRGKTQGLF